MLRRLTLVVLLFLLAAPARAQVLTWTDRLPAARHSPSMAFDSARHVTVLFGGFGGTNDTWEFDGSAWNHRTTIVAPAARYGAAMAYDAARHVCVLFSGSTGTTDTWEWNGSAWTQRAIPGPPARTRPGMVFDSVRNVMVLFGGLSGSSVALADTWEYDGVAWTQRAPAASPPARSDAGFAYDTLRHVAVLFGGHPNSGAFADTWEWDGTTWTQRAVAAPTSRFSIAMAFDSARNAVVLHGGFNASSQILNDTWTFDGSAAGWTPVAAGTPDARAMHAMVFDSARARTVLFGGYQAPFVFYGDTWEWDGALWNRRNATGPLSRTGHAMAYDSAHHLSILFGGVTSTSGPIVVRGDTWSWDGDTWSPLSNSGPDPRQDHALAFDSVRNVCVLFGGRPTSTSTAYFADTWEWDGSAWTQRSIPGPPARCCHSMAYDSARHVVVLFGGLTAQTSGPADTWEYDGSSWTQRNISGPPARFAHRMAFDSVRNVTMLYGGQSPGTSTYLTNMWEYDGTAWTQRIVAGTPASRINHVLAFDPGRQRTILTGGTASNFSGDQWFWSGSAWTQYDQPTPSTSAGFSAFAGDFDIARGMLVCFSLGTFEFGQHGPVCFAPTIASGPDPYERVCIDGSMTFAITANGTGPLAYQWRTSTSSSGPFTPLIDGPTPAGSVISGATTPSLTISHATLADRFLYSCAVSNFCQSATTINASVRLCNADINCSLALEVQDIFDFLNLWFAQAPRADWNNSGTITTADIFAYLTDWFAGCF